MTEAELNAALTNAIENLDAAEAEAAVVGLAVLGTITLVLAISALIVFIISAIGNYKVFQKTGEAGWKAFIPFYSDFIRFRFAWNIRKFWPYLIAAVLTMCIPTGINSVISILAGIAAIVYIVYHVKLCLRIARSFGKSTAFGVLLIFFPFIMTLVLGFGKSQYIGNTTVNSNQ